MKKLVLIFSLFFVTNLMFAGNGEKKNSNETIIKKANGVTISVVEKKSNKADNDALYCSVTCDNGNEYACWLCSCESLPSCDGAQQK